MLTFLAVALTVYGSMNLYALSKVWLVFPHSSALALVLSLWGLVMTVSPLILWRLNRQNWHEATLVVSWATYIWMGFLFLFCCISLVFDLGRLFAHILDFEWPLNGSMAFRSAGLLAVAMLGYGFVEARQIRVEQINIVTPRLSPAVGRVTIAQISDLHLGMMLGDAFLDRVIARLRDMKPDIVAATGDIVDGQGDHLDALAGRFLAIKPPGGAYAVIGNHEVYAGVENSIRFLRNAGFTVLRGESIAAGGITLAGIDDPGAGNPGKEARLDANKARASVRKGGFVVLLKHQPVVDTEIPFDLQLSGHIHGGQIFPFGIFTRLAYGVGTGLTRLADGRRLYVSRGAGTWGPPIRVLAAPEITLITIESGHE